MNPCFWRAALLALCCLAAVAETPFGAGEVAGEVARRPIAEASGLAASRRHPGVLWTHNDSGDQARIFAIGRDGRLLAICTLVGAEAQDYEDIAIGPGPIAGMDYLFVGDIGNNRAHTGGPRPHITVYRVPEPVVEKDTGSPATLDLQSVDALKLTYPDNAHDAEALLVDPDNGDLYILTKRDQPSRIYRATAPGKDERNIELTYLGKMAITQITAADISPNGRELLVKTYPKAFWYPRGEGVSIADALMAAQPAPIAAYRVEPQGEAIAFDAEGMGFYTLSEAKSKTTPLYFYPREKR